MTTSISSNFSAKEWCSIIKACKESGVSHITICGADINFLTNDQVSNNNIDNNISRSIFDQPILQNTPELEELEELHEAENKEFFSMSDPLAFEESLSLGR